MKKNNNKIHKKFEGKIVSVKMDKTIVVRVDRLKKHPVYKKRIKVSKRFKAHDEKNEARLDDFVEIQECSPISKDKKWKLNRIIRRMGTEEVKENREGEEKEENDKNISEEDLKNNLKEENI